MTREEREEEQFGEEADGEYERRKDNGRDAEREHEGKAMGVDVEELKRLAEAATPGPWVCAPSWQHQLIGGKHAGRFDIRTRSCRSSAYSPLAYVRGDKRITGGNGQNNAAFIAAFNPATAMQLINQLEQYKSYHDAKQIQIANTRIGWLAECRSAVGDTGRRSMPNFVEYLKELKQQRDELLAALKSMLSGGAGCLGAARAAIANAEKTT